MTPARSGGPIVLDTLVKVLIAAALIAALAWFGGRLLGIRQSWGRGLVASVLGVGAAAILAFPPEVGAVFRAAVTLEGTLRVLAPGFQLMEEAQKLATRWMSESLVPSALARSVNDELQSLLPMLKRLPRRLDRITEVAERGSLTLKVRLFADARDERVVTTIASRAIIAFLGGVVGLMSVMLLGVSGGPIFYNEISLFQIVGYLGLCASVILIMPVVIAVLRDRAV